MCNNIYCNKNYLGNAECSDLLSLTRVFLYVFLPRKIGQSTAKTNRYSKSIESAGRNRIETIIVENSGLQLAPNLTRSMNGLQPKYFRVKTPLLITDEYQSNSLLINHQICICAYCNHSQIKLRIGEFHINATHQKSANRSANFQYSPNNPETWCPCISHSNWRKHKPPSSMQSQLLLFCFTSCFYLFSATC